jgi:hypothetical protein
MAVVGHSVSTDQACLAEFSAHRASYETENQHIRTACIDSVPFSKSYYCKEILLQTWREPILTITHAPHASRIVAMRYHDRLH